jgi:hypothetical protein
MAQFLKNGLLWASKEKKCRRLSRPRYRPTLEPLEDRTALTGAANWSPVGPAPQVDLQGFYAAIPTASSGRVSALVISGNTMLLGAAGGGVWKSTNFTGASPTWTPLTDNVGLPLLDPNTGLGAGTLNTGSIAAANNAQQIYVGTGEANFGGGAGYGSGVLSTQDGGAHWNLATGTAAVPTAFFRHSFSKLIIDPTNDAVNNLGPSGNGLTVYAALVPQDGYTSDANLGIYKSRDGGVSWTNVTGGLPGGLVVTDLAYTVSAIGRLTLYAAVGNIYGDANNGVYQGIPQADGSVSWTPMSAGLPGPATNIGRISLASDNSGVVYAALSQTKTNGGASLGVYQFNFTTNSWTSMDAPSFVGSQGNFDLAIGISPTSQVYIGGVSYPSDGRAYYGIFQAAVGSTSWRAIDAGANGIWPHTDDHAFAFTPDGKVYLGTDGGIWRFNPGPWGNGYAVMATPKSDVTGDFNADGKRDVAVANYTNNNVSVLLGNGDGTLQAAVNYAVGRNPVGIVAGDFNSDGRTDLATANQGSNNVSVLIANAAGFQRTDYGIGTPFNAATGIVAGDFNGDGALDLVVTLTDGTISFLQGNKVNGIPDGTFQAARNSESGVSRPTVVAAGVFTSSGNLDLLVTDANHTAWLLLGSGNGTFRVGWSSGGSWTEGTNNFAAVGDFNGDGKLDLAMTTPTGKVVIWLGNGNGTFQTPNAINVTQQPQGITAADVNGDGNLDLVVANASGFVTTLLGRGNGSFLNPVNTLVGLNPFAITAGDLNGDRPADLAVTDTQTDRVYVLAGLNRAAGYYALDGYPFLPWGTWDNLNTNLQTSQVDGIALDPVNQGTMLEGSQDNGTALSTNGGTNWNKVGGDDGGLVRFDPNNDLIAYKLIQGGGFALSIDGGLTWTQEWPTGSFPGYTKMAVGEGSPPPIVLGGNNGKVFRTTNRGANWSDITSNGTLTDTSTVTALSYSPSNTNILYAGFSDGAVWVTTNAGDPNPNNVNWSRVTTGTGSALWNGNSVYGLAVDPNDSTTVYLCVAAFDVPQVWRIDSATSTPTLTNITGGSGTNRPAGALPNVPVNTILIQPGTGNLYLGTDVGVYQGTYSGGTPWTRYGNGLPNVPVWDLGLQTYNGHTYLAAATYGRGVWLIDPRTTGHSRGAPIESLKGNALQAATDAVFSLEGINSLLDRVPDRPSPSFSPTPIPFSDAVALRRLEQPSATREMAGLLLPSPNDLRLPFEEGSDREEADTFGAGSHTSRL